MNTYEGQTALFEYAAEGILVTNSKGEIIKINFSAEKMFGYERGELIGKSVETLIPARLSHNHSVFREKYNENPQPRPMGKGRELYAKRKDNSEFPVEISLSNFTSKNGDFVIAFIIDITYRKQAEEKLKLYSQELEKQVENRTLMLKEAIHKLEKTKEEINNNFKREKELNDLKSLFISIASHEFRTPLSTILSSVSLIEAYNGSGYEEKRLKHIQRIKSNVGTLTDILNDFLSLSKLEEGKIQHCPASFDFISFVEEILQEMEYISKKDQQLIFKHIGEEQKAFLDKKLLKNILLNLISNAIKFSAEGSLIQLTSEINKVEIVIIIADNGIGIADEDQAYLFSRFFRGKNAINIQGTGLGLNIVSKYIELMKGKIEFSSKLNEGTTFTIKFPQRENYFIN